MKKKIKTESNGNVSYLCSNLAGKLV